MDNKKVISIAKKLGVIIHHEFPDIFESDAREAAARMLVDLHVEPEILGKLFDDEDFS